MSTSGDSAPPTESKLDAARKIKVLTEVPMSFGSGKKIDPEQAKKLKVDSIEVKIDPRAEWPEMFEDAWRINRDYFYDPHMHGLDWKAIHDKYVRKIPLGRIGVPEDIARAVTFLAGEDAAYISGQCLHVDGALSVGIAGAWY